MEDGPAPGNKGKILLDPGSYEIFVGSRPKRIDDKENNNTEGETQMFGENHAHIFMNALDYHQAVKDHEKAPDERIIRAHFKAYQEKQVSFVRDGGDHLHVLLQSQRDRSGIWDRLQDTPDFCHSQKRSLRRDRRQRV